MPNMKNNNSATTSVHDEGKMQNTIDVNDIFQMHQTTLTMKVIELLELNWCEYGSNIFTCDT